ncbi:hypothetical protein [Maribrevibacterium harenarium]|uniref:hypothetical protein n=1 Tax=Maribrevibacterium harenarium TaxID=2589817 RepID=UPI0015E3A0C1|nr:hypothetical protein [Maribrevibacterium harenarium]
MDSQEQYEALLARWGFVDRSVERQARRAKVKAFFKATRRILVKLIAKSPVLGTQASH